MNYFIEESRHGKFSAELHALRGIAAVIVFLVHLQDGLQAAYPDILLPKLFNGSASVVFFYVLSGLVVGMSLGRAWGKKFFLIEYTIRRVFRIMPLMVVMTTLGGLYIFFINPHMRFPLYDESYGDFSVIKWISGYIGYSSKVNPPAWSIFVELVASALLPFFVLTGRNRKMILAAAVLLTGIALINVIDTQHKWHFYMISFYAGLSILYWGKSVTAKIQGFGPAFFWGLVALLAAGFYLPRIIINMDMYGNPWMPFWETLMVTPLVAIIYYAPQYFSVLGKKIVQFLGDISFSLYLIHFLLIKLALNLFVMNFGATLPVLLLYCATITPLSFLVGHFSYKYLELPFMGLGKKMMVLLESRFSPKGTGNE